MREVASEFADLARTRNEALASFNLPLYHEISKDIFLSLNSPVVASVFTETLSMLLPHDGVLFDEPFRPEPTLLDPNPRPIDRRMRRCSHGNPLRRAKSTLRRAKSISLQTDELVTTYFSPLSDEILDAAKRISINVTQLKHDKDSTPKQRFLKDLMR